MGLLGTMSAVGTALGPTLGGLLIAGPGWPAIFIINVPLATLAMLLSYYFLPADRPSSVAAVKPRFDHVGTLILALTLTAYSLAATLGRGSFDVMNVTLLIAALIGAILFVLAELRSSSPIIPIAMLRSRGLSSGLVMSALVTTVVMATLVVGPFYLSGVLSLDAVGVGLVMSCGPIVAALAGVPAGRLADRFGTQRVTVAGLLGMITGSSMLAIMPASFGTGGYIVPLVALTAGYGLFQAANNTAVMSDISPDRRGVISGMLTMSRNLGLITGAAVMAAVFAASSGMTGVTTTSAEAVTRGMRVTFTLAAFLIVIALAIAVANRVLSFGHRSYAHWWTRFRVQSF